MDYQQTNLDFLPNDLVNVFGKERGQAIYQAACIKYEALSNEEKKFENEVMNEHVFRKILPAIALYFTFIEEGYPKEEALQLTLNETQKNALRLQAKNAKLSKIPLTYKMFKLFVKSHMRKNYPTEGWDVEWQRLDNQEIHFDMTRCIYSQMCQKYNCPELCTVFCQNDITAFKGYLPKIGFKRNGTIGEGSCRCDFHYIHLK